MVWRLRFFRNMGKGPLALAYLFAGRTSRSEHSHATRFTIVDVNHLAAVGQQISRCGRTNPRVEVTGCCGEQVFQILISITGILRASELPPLARVNAAWFGRRPIASRKRHQQNDGRTIWLLPTYIHNAWRQQFVSNLGLSPV